MMFSAVRTTGIYCRPGCGARPLADNVRTFEMAAAAEAAGYRACLRCRPYRQGSAVPWQAPELICRAVQLIIAGVLDNGGEDELGARLAISPRHLRRAFDEHLGMTPAQLARSRRAHFARRLLDDTDLTVTEIAFASGFGSLRQFNRSMVEVFRAAPNQLRARRRVADRLVVDGGIAMRIPLGDRAYDWPATARLLANRAVPGVESVSDGVYRRTISLDGSPGVLELSAADADHLLLKAHLPYWEGLIHIVERAASMVGITRDWPNGYATLARDDHIGPLVRAYPGLRVLGAWSGFEAACAEMAGHEIGPLVRDHGVPVPGLGHGLTHLFPSPQRLRSATHRGVRSLAEAVDARRLVIDEFVQPADLIGAVPEIAQRIVLRVGSPDAFPADDTDVAQAMLALDIPNTAPATWRPWRSLASTYLVDHTVRANAAPNARPTSERAWCAPASAC